MAEPKTLSKKLDPMSYGRGYRKGYLEGYRAAKAGLSSELYPGLIENPEMPLSAPIECLELDARSYNCLWREKIWTVGQLISCTEKRLLNIINFGTGCLKNVKARLAHYQYSLATDQ
jgi:hypothetical protein